MRLKNINIDKLQIFIYLSFLVLSFVPEFNDKIGLMVGFVLIIGIEIIVQLKRKSTLGFLKLLFIIVCFLFIMSKLLYWSISHLFFWVAFIYSIIAFIFVFIKIYKDFNYIVIITRSHLLVVLLIVVVSGNALTIINKLGINNSVPSNYQVKTYSSNENFYELLDSVDQFKDYLLLNRDSLISNNQFRVNSIDYILEKLNYLEAKEAEVFGIEFHKIEFSNQIAETKEKYTKNISLLDHHKLLSFIQQLSEDYRKKASLQQGFFAPVKINNHRDTDLCMHTNYINSGI